MCDHYCLYCFHPSSDLSVGSRVAGAPCRMLHPNGGSTESHPGSDADHAATQRQPRRLPEAQHAALQPRRSPRVTQVSFIAGRNKQITSILAGMQIELIFISRASHVVLPKSNLARMFSLCSHIRECLKLDQDDKECFGHYKQVKKLSKQLDSAEELIQQDRSVLLQERCTFPS